MDLNVENEVFTGIDKPETVVSVILMKVLYGQTFGNLKDLGVDAGKLMDTLDVQKTLGSIRSTGQDTVSQAAGLMTEGAGGMAKEAGSVVRDAKGQLGGFLKKIKAAGAALEPEK